MGGSNWPYDVSGNLASVKTELTIKQVENEGRGRERSRSSCVLETARADVATHLLYSHAHTLVACELTNV